MSESEKSTFARWSAVVVMLSAILVLAGVKNAAQLAAGWAILLGGAVGVVCFFIGLFLYGSTRFSFNMFLGTGIANFSAGVVIGSLVAGYSWARFLLYASYLSALGFGIFCLLVLIYPKWLEDDRSALVTAWVSCFIGGLVFAALQLGFRESSFAQVIGTVLLGFCSCTFLGYLFHKHYLESHTRGTMVKDVLAMPLAWFLDPISNMARDRTFRADY